MNEEHELTLNVTTAGSANDSGRQTIADSAVQHTFDLSADLIGDGIDLNFPDDLVEGILEADLDTCRKHGAEHRFEVYGDSTVIVTSGCSCSARTMVRAIRAQFETRVHLHPRVVLDADAPASEEVPAALYALESLERADPSVFQHGGKLVQVKGVSLVRLSPVQLRIVLAQACRWRDGRGRWVDPPAGVVSMILALGQYFGIPEVERVVSAPVLAPDGSLVRRPGYHSASRLYYAPTDPSLVTIDLPDEVTEEDVREARKLLEEDLLGDFPFDGQASRANALGAMLVPFLRDCIEGPTPLHLIDKPEAGTGAGLLAACISIPGAGLNVESSQWSHKEDERRKTILSVLADGRTVVLWDNVEGAITSPTLNSMLTQPIFSDRRLNTNNAVGYAVRCLHLMTANNGKPVGDTVRRVTPIRLDAGVEYPAERTGPEPGRGWRHPLPSWAEQNRAELVRAVLVLCRWWVQAGKPLAPLTGFGSYERYEEVVGGVLTAAGVEGFLTNRPHPEDVDENRAAYTALLRKWAELYGDEWKTAKDVAEDKRMHPLLEDLGIAPDDAGELGTLLRDNRGAVRDSRRIERGKRRENRMTWRVANA